MLKVFASRFIKLSYFFTLAVLAVGHAATIQGVIQNIENHKPLPQANISLVGTTAGAVSNANGVFVLTDLPAGDIVVEVGYIGFESRRLTVTLQEDETRRLDILLTPTTLAVEEVTVTSLKYERSLRDLAAPVAIVGSRQIEKTMPRDVSEAVQNEPGLTITRDGVWGTHVNIRGLSRNNIVMLIDGNRIDTANDLAAGLSMIDVNDVERVEVIKGSGSSLYGTGAIGGVVNIQSKDSWYADNFYLHANVTGGYGSANNSRQGFFQLNSGGKRWRLKVSGMERTAEDVDTPAGQLPNSGYNDKNIAVRLAYKPFEQHEFRVNWQSYRGTDIGIPGGNTLFPGAADVRYPRENRDLLSFVYEGRNLTPKLARVSLKYFMQDILRDVENIPHTVSMPPGEPPTRVTVRNILPIATHTMNGVQLQTDWRLHGQTLITGVDAWQKELDSFRTRNLQVEILRADGSTASTRQQTIAERPIPLSTYRSTGFFVQDEIPLWQKRLIVTIGGRYDVIQVENDKTFNPVYLVVDGVKNEHPPTQKLLWEEQTVQNNSWSGNASALVKLSSKTDLTATYARSFRAPYLEERYQYIDLGNLVKIGEPNLLPEQGQLVDVGLRFWGNVFTFSGNVFYNDITNMVVEAAGTYEGRNALLKKNVGSAELYGFDLGLELSLWRTLQLFGNVAHVRGQDTFVDEPLPLVPPVNGRAGLRGDLWHVANFEIAVAMFGEQDRIATWELVTPGYTVVDFYLTSSPFMIGSLSSKLFFGIDNVLDRAYRNHLSTNRGSVAMEPGRNVSVRWQLGF